MKPIVWARNNNISGSLTLPDEISDNPKLKMLKELKTHIMLIFSRPGQSQGCSTNPLVINSLINSLSHHLVKIFLRRRLALIVGDCAFSHKIDYVTIFKEILNLDGHHNCIAGSKVTTILLNRWILPIGGGSWGRVCAQPAKQACFNMVYSYLAMRKVFINFGPAGFKKHFREAIFTRMASCWMP